ncbi:hypothetical protein AB85_2813 [Escherichia coli 2-156-04_S3_C1]|nr:hypothetical protein AB85_2813 [Escherichia coli 2-156-04_S3_C1]
MLLVSDFLASSLCSSHHKIVEASGRARYRIDDSSEIFTENSSPVSPVFGSKNTAPIEITGAYGPLALQVGQLMQWQKER